jgi:hypothetical protein
MPSRAKLASALSAVAVAVLAAGGCQGQDTGLFLSVVTDLHAPDELSGLGLELKSGDQSYSSGARPWALGPGAPYQLPGSFAIYGQGGETVDITVTGYLGDQPVVQRQAQVTLIGGRVMFLRVALSRRCLDGAAPTCGDDQSCVEGACRPRQIDGTGLPDNSPGEDAMLACDSGSQFVSTSNGQALPSGGSCSASQFCQEALCLPGSPPDAGPPDGPGPDVPGDGGDMAIGPDLPDVGGVDADLVGPDFPDLVVDVPPSCPPSTDVLSIDAELGDDVAGNGTTMCPYRSIGRALLAAAQNTMVTTLEINGTSTAGAQLVYSSDTTREAYPLVLTLTLTLRGAQGPQLPLLSGGGNCPLTFSASNCTIAISASGVELNRLAVQNTAGRGVVFGGASSNGQLTDSMVMGCQDEAVLLNSRAKASLDNVVLTGSQSGLFLNSSAAAIVNNVQITASKGIGLRIDDTATVTSTGITVTGSGSQGVAIASDGTWMSTGDQVTASASDGVKLGSGSGSAGTVVMMGGMVINNGTGSGGGHGFNLSCNVATGVCLTLNGTTVLGNKNTGIKLVGSSSANLGDSTTPGNNVFHAPTGSALMRNGQAAICNQSSKSIQARADHFSKCAPAEAVSTGCGAAQDVSEARSGSVVTTGCVTP